MKHFLHLKGTRAGIFDENNSCRVILKHACIYSVFMGTN
jgi:hypothetical protein